MLGISEMGYKRKERGQAHRGCLTGTESWDKGSLKAQLLVQGQHPRTVKLSVEAGQVANVALTQQGATR